MTPADRAHAEVRARILDVRLRPGQIVPELALAAELGMGRATIHDALVRLQAEGLVEALPRRGFAVTSPTTDTMREIYEIVGSLEGQCVRRAARDGGAILRAAIEGQATALARDDLDGWVEADRRFHDLLREAAANRRLRGLIQRFGGQLQQVRALTIRFRDRPHRSTDDHQAILAAIQSGDEDEAVRVHHAHRRRADAEMLAALAEYARVTGHPQPDDVSSRAALADEPADQPRDAQREHAHQTSISRGRPT